MSYIKKSPWVLHYDGMGCGGCGIEALACLSPVYDIERFGMIFTDNPRHADILLITGGFSEENREEIIDIYEQMSSPKAVVAAGMCAMGEGIYSEGENAISGVDAAIPVDVIVPGCAADAESIVAALVNVLEEGDDEKQSEEE